MAEITAYENARDFGAGWLTETQCAELVAEIDALRRQVAAVSGADLEAAIAQSWCESNPISTGRDHARAGKFYAAHATPYVRGAIEILWNKGLPVEPGPDGEPHHG